MVMARVGGHGKPCPAISRVHARRPVDPVPQEDMRRGYFDDFRDFRDNHGKTFACQSWKASAAPAFPPLKAMLSDGSTTHLPFDAGIADLTLVAIAFRAGAQVRATRTGPVDPGAWGG